MQPNPMDGNELIIRDILQIYLIRILKADKSICTVQDRNSLEKPYIFNLSLESGDGKP